MRPLFPLVILLAGCTPAASAAWVPRVSVRGVLIRGRQIRGESSADRWSWRIAASARWTLARPVPIPPREPRVGLPEHRSTGGVGCEHEAICAWEHEARTRALRELSRTR